MKKNLKQRIKTAIREEIAIGPYNPEWPSLFEKEAAFFQSKLPKSLVKRIEHFGSTAIPGLSAKPIIDILVEVSSLDETKKQIVPILESEGYDYFWRPTIGNQPPYYAWFIKRDSDGRRTHHIHTVERDSDVHPNISLWTTIQQSHFGLGIKYIESTSITITRTMCYSLTIHTKTIIKKLIFIIQINILIYFLYSLNICYIFHNNHLSVIKSD